MFIRVALNMVFLLMIVIPAIALALRANSGVQAEILFCVKSFQTRKLNVNFCHYIFKTVDYLRGH